MWTAEYKDYISALTQAKYREEVNPPEALRTIDSDLLYIQNRGKPEQARSSKISNELWVDWKNVEKALIGDDGTRCLRLMIQYPKKHAKVATPARTHLDDKTPCSTDWKRKHALLSTVSGTNAEDLFGEKAIDKLDFLKGREAFDK
jgi:hypothetical protein